jgi:hypothetical protein
MLSGISSDEKVLKAIIDAPDFAPGLSLRLSGILFLGTPHRGSETADVASVLTGVVNAAARLGSLGLAKNPLQQNILNELRTGSKPLRELHDTFRKRVSEIQVKSFFETKDTVIRGKSLGVVCNSRFTSSWNQTDNCGPDCG